MERKRSSFSGEARIGKHRDAEFYPGYRRIEGNEKTKILAREEGLSTLIGREPAWAIGKAVSSQGRCEKMGQGEHRTTTPRPHLAKYTVDRGLASLLRNPSTGCVGSLKRLSTFFEFEELGIKRCLNLVPKIMKSSAFPALFKVILELIRDSILGNRNEGPGSAQKANWLKCSGPVHIWK